MDPITPHANSISSTERPETVLAAIPGWQHARYRELQGGLTNRSLLVESAGARAVLKIDSAPRSRPYNSRDEEARVQSTAAGIGIAARVLFADDTVFMSEYQDGSVWTRESLDDENNLIALAAVLRRVHSLPLTGRTYDALAAARLYGEHIDDADPEIVKRCISVVESMPVPHNLCCCHNDLVAQNIIATPELKLLDWEYACDNDPFFDLATVVAHHELNTTKADLLLEAYFDGDGQRWREQLIRQERLYDALHWLWLAAFHADEPALDGVYERLK